jgi:SAM-dependent methyltransferase
VVEIGCGSGLLTRHLVDAGHRVIATDASPAMLDLARQAVGDAEDVVRLTLPDDPIPAADAIVGVGHALNYLPDEESLDRALVAIAQALRPGGVLAIDLCDLEWAAARVDEPSRGWVGEDWALVTRFSVPSPDRYVPEMATFLKNDDGSWRRGDERHDNVLIDTARVQALAEQGVEAEVRGSFGTETLPVGLRDRRSQGSALFLRNPRLHPEESEEKGLTLERMFDILSSPPPRPTPREVPGMYERNDHDVVASMDASHGRICAEQRTLFSLIAEADRRELWQRDGARDMAHWLWMRYGISDWKARRWLAAARLSHRCR